MTDETQGEGDPLVDDTAPASNEAETTSEDTGDDAAASTDNEGEDGEQPAKPKQSAKERIDELTRLRRDAERDAEYWRSKAMQPDARQPERNAPPAQADDGEPNPDDYEHGTQDIAFIEDRAAYRAVQAVEKRMAAQQAQQGIRTKLSAFDAKTDELFPDGEPQGLKSFKANPRLDTGAQELIMESDIGPKLADHLGSNPRELARISALPPLKQARELTLLETRLSGPAKPVPKTATSAPEPAPQARGSGGRFQVAPDTDDFAAFEKLADSSG